MNIVAPIGYNKKLLENEKTCLVCTKGFIRRGQRKFTAKFCSFRCKGKWQKGKPTSIPIIRNGLTKKCILCSESFYTFPSYIEKKYCSKKCYYKSLIGRNLAEKHWNWKGGIKPINQKLRTSWRCSKWRKKIFVRDDFTCKECGIKGGQLEAHHIKSWSKYPKLRFKILNGITLCKKCHKLTDNYKRKS